MLKILQLIIFSLFLFQTTSYAKTIDQNKINFTEEEQAWIQDHPTVIVGGERDWVPFDFVDKNGNYTGITKDYLDLISKKIGIKFDIKLDTWNNLLSGLDSGKINILPAMYYSDERAIKYNLTSEYHKVKEYIFGDLKKNIDLRNMKNKTFAMVKGY